MTPPPDAKTLLPTEASQVTHQVKGSQPESLNCSSLHHRGCDTPLRRDWQYCPHCGSTIADFSLELVRTVKHADESVSCEVLMVPTPPSAVAGYAKIATAGNAKSDKASVSLLNPGGSKFTITFPAGSDEGTSISVTLPNVERDPDADPFIQPWPKRHAIQVSPVVRTTNILEAYPSYLRLAAGHTAEVSLHTLGDSIVVKSIESEGDITLQGENIHIVRPGTGATFKIRAEQLKGRAVVRFKGLNNETIGSVTVDPLPKVMTKLEARFIIGIDIGTSGTSVWRYDITRGTSPESILEAARIPTAVFMGNRNNRSSWRYGTEARKEASEIGISPITEFKQYLQEVDDTIPAHAIGAEELISWYLERLCVEHTIPGLEGILGGPVESGDVTWHLTMPVYDSSTRSERYRDRLLRAAQEAGLTNYGEVVILLEPECAMHALVHNGKLEAAKLPYGSRVMVVDSGGGTTDVSVGSLVDEGGKLALADINSYSVTMKKDVARGLLTGPDFGGRDITRLTGAFAIAKFAKRESNDEHAAAKRYSQLAGKLGSTCEGRAAFGFNANFFFPSENCGHFWFESFPRLYEDVERSKCNLRSHLSTPFIEVLPVEDDGLTVTQSDVTEAKDELSSNYKSDLEEIIDMDIEFGKARPSAVAFVGGNNLLMAKNFKLPNVKLLGEFEDIAQTCVVQGSALPTPKAASPSPYPVRIMIEREGSLDPLIAVSGAEAVSQVRSAGRIIEPSSAPRFSIVVFADIDETYLLRRYTVNDNHDGTTVRGTIKENRVTIELASMLSDGKKPTTLELELV